MATARANARQVHVLGPTLCPFAKYNSSRLIMAAKRIGLALSDELRLTAQPLGTLLRTNRQADLRRLRDTCRSHAVSADHSRASLAHTLGEVGAMADESARFATATS